MKICLENLFEASAKDQIEQFDYLFGRYPADFLGLCIDTGHANLVGGNEFIKLLATRYADRFFCQHLHDNRGWGKEDGAETHTVCRGNAALTGKKP